MKKTFVAIFLAFFVLLFFGLSFEREKSEPAQAIIESALAQSLSSADILGLSESNGRLKLDFSENECDTVCTLFFDCEKGIIPIVCCGESLEQRENGITFEHIAMQIKLAMKSISATDACKVIIAYEPIWAIGTGRTATDEQANEVCAAIRKTLASIYDEKTADTIRILYGGSMNAKNAEGLLSMSDIDGGLIGGASLKEEDFSTIINFA